MNKIRYCSECGAKMEVYKTEPAGSKFDVNTGEKNTAVYHYWRCPNKKHWWDRHDKYNEIPDTYQ